MKICTMHATREPRTVQIDTDERMVTATLVIAADPEKGTPTWQISPLPSFFWLSPRQFFRRSNIEPNKPPLSLQQ